MIDFKWMGLSKIDFNWNTMVGIKDFSCPHAGLDFCDQM
jgi:hypothetical protein